MKDEESAGAAIKALRGYFFYGRPLRVFRATKLTLLKVALT